MTSWSGRSTRPASLSSAVAAHKTIHRELSSELSKHRGNFRIADEARLRAEHSYYEKNEQYVIAVRELAGVREALALCQARVELLEQRLLATELPVNEGLYLSPGEMGLLRHRPGF